MASYEKHPAEQLIDDLEERFNKDLQNMVDFATIHGRLMFTVPLSKDDQWRRFANPETRRRVIDRILREEGPAAVKTYINHMVSIAKSLVKEPPVG